MVHDESWGVFRLYDATERLTNKINLAFMTLYYEKQTQ